MRKGLRSKVKCKFEPQLKSAVEKGKTFYSRKRGLRTFLKILFFGRIEIGLAWTTSVAQTWIRNV